MKSFATAEFWQAYAELSPEMQDQARKAYRLWQENSLHPSLHFESKFCFQIDMNQNVVNAAFWQPTSPQNLVRRAICNFMSGAIAPKNWCILPINPN
jgi:hypothetical protein